jgi:hypothetical protein
VFALLYKTKGFSNSSTPAEVLTLRLLEVTIKRLKNAGVKTVEMLASMEPGELCKATDYRSPSWCVEIVAIARRCMELLELAKRNKLSRHTPLIQLIEKLFEEPLFILTISELASILRESFKKYCIELYMRSTLHNTLKLIIEECYNIEEERRRHFEEATTILKQDWET